MKNLLIVCLAFVLTLSFSNDTFAQKRGKHKGNHKNLSQDEKVEKRVSRLTKKLDLDASQQSQITSIMNETEAKTADLKSNLKGLNSERREKIKALKESGETDQIKTLNTGYKDRSKGDLNAMKSIMEGQNEKIKSVLNEDQKAIYTAQVEKRMKKKANKKRNKLNKRMNKQR